MKNPIRPAVTATTLRLSDKHFANTAEARDALKKAVDAIPDAELQYVRAVQVVVMM